MKKTIIAALLLMSFGMAEEANQSTERFIQESIQETKQNTPKSLQDLGRGYAKDPTTNQIYYKGKEVYVYNPKTFQIIKDDNEEGYDAEDHYRYYKQGWSSISTPFMKNLIIYDLPPRKGFDTELNIPVQCFDYKEDAEELMQCYQKNVYPEKWPTNPPMNPKTFKIVNIKEKMTNNLWDVWAVADQYRIILFTSLYRSKEVFVLDNISDFTSFMLIGEHRNNAIMHGDYTDAIFLYFKDKNYVYNNLGVIEGADAETFEVLEHPYTKDKNHVYYKGKILKDAVSSEFELLDYRLHIARDKQNIFYKNQILKGLDNGTFKILSSPFPSKRYYRDGVDISPARVYSVCPIALLMDKNNFLYLDIFSLLSEEPIILSINGNKEEDNSRQTNNLIEIPFQGDHTNTEMIGSNHGSCMLNTYAFFKSNNTIYTLYRWNSSVFFNKVNDVDVESFKYTPEGWIIDRRNSYDFDRKNYILRKRGRGIQ